MSFKAEGYGKASYGMLFMRGQLYKDGKLIARLRNVSVTRALKEVKSGFRGIVRAHVASASIQWKADKVEFTTDPGLNLNNEYLTLICSAPNVTTTEWNYARLHRCTVHYVSTQGDDVSVKGEAFPDENGNVVEFILSPDIPDSVPVPDLKPLGSAFQQFGYEENASSAILGMGAPPPPEKKKEEKKPIVPGVVVFTKRAIDFDDE